MYFVADLHCHTNVSHHAFSTLEEMAAAAAEKDLKAIAITNHARANPDSAHDWHFPSMFIIPRKIKGVNILKGCEVNAIDWQGSLDLDDGILQQLELVVASVHQPYCVQPTTFEQHTVTYQALLNHPCVDILGHPGDPCYLFDYDAIAHQAAQCHKAIELNGHAIRRFPHSIDNYRQLIQAALRHNTPLSVASDAHISFSLGEFGVVPDLLRELSVPTSQIINHSLENLNRFFQNRGKSIVLD